MAISATLTRIVSSIVKVVNTKEDNTTNSASVPDLPRRGILLSTLFLAADSKTDLLQSTIFTFVFLCFFPVRSIIWKIFLFVLSFFYGYCICPKLYMLYLCGHAFQVTIGTLVWRYRILEEIGREQRQI